MDDSNNLAIEVIKKVAMEGIRFLFILAVLGIVFGIGLGILIGVIFF